MKAAVGTVAEVEPGTAASMAVGTGYFKAPAARGG